MSYSSQINITDIGLCFIFIFLFYSKYSGVYKKNIIWLFSVFWKLHSKSTSEGVSNDCQSHVTSVKQASCYERLEISVVHRQGWCLLYITISEDTATRVEVDSLVDSVQTWNAGFRASGVRVPARELPLRYKTSLLRGFVRFKTDVMDNIGSTASSRTAPLRDESALHRHVHFENSTWFNMNEQPWFNMNEQPCSSAHRWYVRSGGGWWYVRGDDMRAAYPQIADNLASCLLISIHCKCFTSVWRAGSLDFWTGIQVQTRTR